MQKNSKRKNDKFLLFVFILFFFENTFAQIDRNISVNLLSKYKIGYYLELKNDTVIKNGTKRNFIIENKLDTIQSGFKKTYFYNIYKDGTIFLKYKTTKNLNDENYFDTIISPLTLNNFNDTIPNIRITYSSTIDSVKTYSFLINMPIKTIKINSKIIYKCQSYAFSGANYHNILEQVKNEYKVRRSFIWDHSFESYYDSSFNVPLIYYHHMSIPYGVYITKFYQFDNIIKYELKENDFVFYLQNLNSILGW